MKVIILSDDRPHPYLDLLTEHGLSIYFEADGFKWLMDVGASDQYYTNALRLGVSVEDIDYLILSHGHADHTGGVEHFIRHNQKAQIIMSARVQESDFYSLRLHVKRYIGIDHVVVEQNIHRFILLEHDKRVSEHVACICDIPRNFAVPKANNKLFQADGSGERLDEFQHEVALAVRTSHGVVVFSGCSHNGLLNILQACSGYFSGARVMDCVGGTHLVDGNELNFYESDAEIHDIGCALLDLYPKMCLITGHCTGTHAQQQLSYIMGNKCSAFYSGAVMEL